MITLVFLFFVAAKKQTNRMKTFIVLSCLVAVVCGLNRYQYGGGGGSFGASKFGYEAQQQSAHHESHQSSSQVSSAGGIASSGGIIGGAGGLVDSYGGAAGGIYDAQGLAASQISANSIASRSSFGAAESAISAGGYGSEYGVGGIHDAAGIAGSGVGLGGGSIGGFNSYNGGSFNRQSSMSRSSSFSQSSASSHSLVQYETEWPELYKVPLFQSLCGLKSTMKSQELYSTIGRQYRANQFDYGSTFTDLYSKNALLQKFFYTATGVRYQDSYRNNYVQLINQQPMHALRLATIFARNPSIFTSPYGQFIIGGSSLELLQGYQTSATRYSYESFSSSRFLTSLVRSRYYSRTLASVFGLQSNLSYDLLQQQLVSRIGGYYRSNAAGTLLLLRHILARRQISSLEPYLGCTGADIYSSQLDNYWGQKSWRHNSYYSSWSRQFARSSSFSSTSSRSSRVMSRSLSANNLGYSGIGI